MNLGRISVVIRRGRRQRARIGLPQGVAFLLGLLGISALIFAVYECAEIHSHYTFIWRSPVRVQFQSPLLMAQRTQTVEAHNAQREQESSLTSYQEYACQKFGPACRVALAIQRSENPQGKCEVYHYNRDGTLDWGYFQINTVHLKRRGVNLRDLLDCKANIDFAYQLYLEHQGFTPWSVYNSGRYQRFLGE
jgi:hypothetical protein